jgi:transcription elongation factor Elf1
MNSVDLKYCGFLSIRLNKYKVKTSNPYKATYRCPLCGDSQKSKTKTRGWIIEKENKAFTHCFNCGASHPLWRFLKLIEPNLYSEYVIDTKLENHSTSPLKPLETLQQKVPNYRKIGSPLLLIKRIGSLAADHPARTYLNMRQIPIKQHHRLYYAPKFASWVNEIIPGKLNSNLDEPRLILPFIDANGNIFGFQGRAFNKKSLRYITIMLEDKPKIFGLDKIDFEKRYYVVEGPIDSLFLSNALAMAGADGSVVGLSNIDNAVFVLDNEPRNAEIVQRMENLIDQGRKICVWPKHIKQKDINDMILAGLSGPAIENIIDSYCFSGLSAKLALLEWKRC